MCGFRWSLCLSYPWAFVTVWAVDFWCALSFGGLFGCVLPKHTQPPPLPAVTLASRTWVILPWAFVTGSLAAVGFWVFGVRAHLVDSGVLLPFSSSFYCCGCCCLFVVWVWFVTTDTPHHTRRPCSGDTLRTPSTPHIANIRIHIKAPMHMCTLAFWRSLVFFRGTT